MCNFFVHYFVYWCIIYFWKQKLAAISSETVILRQNVGNAVASRACYQFGGTRRPVNTVTLGQHNITP